MKMTVKKYRDLIIFCVVLAAWLGALLFISPEEIVANVGVETGYLLVFLTALIGISSITSASFYATVIILASSGEFNPLFLALSAAPAMAIGDSIFFFLGLKGRSLVPEKYLNKFSDWLKERPDWLAPVVAYFYTGFTPLPQDFLMVTLGVSGATFWKILIAILLGNITFIFMLASIISAAST